MSAGRTLTSGGPHAARVFETPALAQAYNFLSSQYSENGLGNKIKETLPLNYKEVKIPNLVLGQNLKWLSEENIFFS